MAVCKVNPSKTLAIYIIQYTPFIMHDKKKILFLHLKATQHLLPSPYTYYRLVLHIVSDYFYLNNQQYLESIFRNISDFSQ